MNNNASILNLSNVNLIIALEGSIPLCIMHTLFHITFNSYTCIDLNKNVMLMMLKCLYLCGCRGRDRMEGGFSTTNTISAYHH